MENGSFPLDVLDSSTVPPVATPSASLRKTLRFLQILSVVVFIVTFLLGMAGNGLVIWVSGFRMPRSVNSVWFLHLAVADFTFCLFLPFSIVYVALGFHWPFGRLLCKLYHPLSIFNLFASVFLLTLISTDRCICVLRPVWARNHRTWGRANLAAGVAWLLALAFSSPYLVFRDIAVNARTGKTDCAINYDPWNETRGDPGRRPAVEGPRFSALVLTRFVLGFVVPLVVIGGCCILLASRIWRQRLARSNRPFRVLGAVVAAFFLCWFPFHLLSLLKLASILGRRSDLNRSLSILGPLAFCMICVNSCLNPVLYVFLGRDFQKRLLRSLPSALERAFAEEPGSASSLTKSTVPVDGEFQELRVSPT
ncbi:N-formyl peptide receptor 2-like [Tachyglossus aculeatus]|uniref:N-formyl peptide receptor 2-like n=1 Tax=Tachyglossus aculeatus TaxID=9261 RepID=UPI0018F28F48|nr:N-formyl peptide receptor 2-like [Tachyglossus aculeatus]XP_038623482.1 N-formyl peptide receptor 2-like [Tachyglossus aculeatus]